MIVPDDSAAKGNDFDLVSNIEHGESKGDGIKNHTDSEEEANVEMNIFLGLSDSVMFCTVIFGDTLILGVLVL